MNGIKMSDCHFYVNEPERTVVCVIPATMKANKQRTSQMLLNFVQEHFQFSDVNMYDALSFWSDTFSKELTMPRSFIGKAVCAPEDEWNEETGRMIAFSRAKDKCYKSFFKRANTLVQTVDRRLGDMITMFNDFGMKLEDKREGLQQKINERVGNTEEE